jgi:hypothetical protein
MIVGSDAVHRINPSIFSLNSSNFHDGVTCTTCHRAPASLEARLKNSILICFHVKQAPRSRRVSRAVFIIHRFCDATDKPYPAWFYGPNQEIIAVILRPKSPNRSCRFWGPNWETWATDFETKSEETVTTGFEAKLGETVPLVLRLN